MRALIVNDVSSNRKLLGRLFKNRGHQYEEAENGAIAVDKVLAAAAAGEAFHTILMDYDMPVMKDPEAAL